MNLRVTLLLPENSGDAVECCRTVLANPLVKGGQRGLAPTLASTLCMTSVLRGLEEKRVATC